MAQLAVPIQPALAGRNRAPTSLWLPRWSLSRCVRAVVVRSTLGLGRNWPPAWHYNHFPASPLCTVGWLLDGHTEMVEAGRRWRVPRVYFAGPHTRPTVSCNSPEGKGLILMLLPDAVQALTGLDPARCVNRVLPVEAALGARWQVLGQAVLDAADDEARVALIEDFLEPRWLALRPGAGAPGLRCRDWAEGLAMRAATTGVGRSLRQIERRIKGWTGLPMRELRGLGRAEQAFFHALMQGNPDQAVRWSEVAADVGYADQSHLCRETRRITGFAPAELRRRIAEDEGFWLYRIWA